MPGAIPSNPLQRIALSCSGGGYRATSFHLGSMSYLNRLKFKGRSLLENVKLMSTVSGGTFTGVVYAVLKQKGMSFEMIYDFMMDKLKKVDLIKQGIEKLNPDTVWINPNKRKNLINAFAELYDQHFTQGATFADLNEMKSHLEEVIFNSTEFNNGVNFRFRNKGTGIFGNNYLRITQEAAEQVLLADAIASSACFPGGFEPIVWPADFAHDRADKLKKLAKHSPQIGLMDGGIYDNQGIQSILLHEKRGKHFDLIVISDVASPYMNPFVPMMDKPKTGVRNLTLNEFWNQLRKVNAKINLGLVTIFILLCVVPIFWGYRGTFWTGLLVGASLVPLSILLIKKILLGKVKSHLASLRQSFVNKIPAFYLTKLKSFNLGALSLRRVEPLIFDRLNSLLTLLLDVFLKIVRRLNYTTLYEDDQFLFRRCSNLIKELTQIDFESGKSQAKKEIQGSINYPTKTVLRGEYEHVVGNEIRKIVDESSSFGTTLWFSDEAHLSQMLDKLVSTGQFTMCYNMLDYMETILFVEKNGFESLPKQLQDELVEVYNQCLTDWKLFKVDPMFMIRPAQVKA